MTHFHCHLKYITCDINYFDAIVMTKNILQWVSPKCLEGVGVGDIYLGSAIIQICLTNTKQGFALSQNVGNTSSGVNPTDL